MTAWNVYVWHVPGDRYPYAERVWSGEADHAPGAIRAACDSDRAVKAQLPSLIARPVDADPYAEDTAQ